MSTSELTAKTLLKIEVTEGNGSSTAVNPQISAWEV